MLFRNQKNSRPASAHYVISSFPNTFLFKIKHLFVLFILSRQVLSEVLRYRLCCILHERSAATFVNQLIKQRHTSCYGYKLSKTPNVKRLTLKNMKIAIRAKLAITRYRHLSQMRAGLFWHLYHQSWYPLASIQLFRESPSTA